MGVEHSVQAFEAMDSRLTLYSVLRGSGRGRRLVGHRVGGRGWEAGWEASGRPARASRHVATTVYPLGVCGGGVNSHCWCGSGI